MVAPVRVISSSPCLSLKLGSTKTWVQCLGRGPSCVRTTSSTCVMEQMSVNSSIIRESRESRTGMSWVCMTKASAQTLKICPKVCGLGTNEVCEKERTLSGGERVREPIRGCIDCRFTGIPMLAVSASKGNQNVYFRLENSVLVCKSPVSIAETKVSTYLANCSRSPEQYWRSDWA